MMFGVKLKVMVTCTYYEIGFEWLCMQMQLTYWNYK